MPQEVPVNGTAVLNTAVPLRVPGFESLPISSWKTEGMRKNGGGISTRTARRQTVFLRGGDVDATLMSPCFPA